MPEALLVSLLTFAAFGAGLTVISVLVDALVDGFAGRRHHGVVNDIASERRSYAENHASELSASSLPGLTRQSIFLR
jgi:hypothetical protein